MFSLHDQEKIFNNKKDALLKSYDNSLKSEAYRRKDEFLSLVINPNRCEISELMKECKDLTYKDYENMKRDWLKNVSTEWLVYGHLDEKSARDLVEDCEGYIKEQKSDVEIVRNYVMLKSGTINEYSISHPNDDNQNSTAV